MSGTETGVDTGLEVCNGTLTTEGDFTFYGLITGVEVDNDCTVMGGLKAIGGAYGYGFYYWGGDGHGLTLVPGLMIKTRLELKGDNAAMSSDKSKYTISSSCSREIAVDGGRINAYSYNIYNINNNDLAKQAVLRFTDSENDGSAEHPYSIFTTDDWYALSHEIALGEPTAGKYFCLANNDVVATTTLGTAEYPFSGTFYGWTAGAELTANLNHADVAGCAPFRYISDATIKDIMVRGSITGGRDCAGLVGYVSGGTNLIQDCEVVANIASYSQNCGGIVGHAGSATTTLKDCAFAGSFSGLVRYGSGVSIPGTMGAATLVGQSGSDATLTLTGCVDVSEDSRPIGQGTVDALTVSNTYYTYTGNKKNTDIGSWSGKAKLGYSVVAGSNDFALSLADGSAGTQSFGTIYAAKDESVNFTVSPNNDIFKASAGALSYENGVYTLEMPAQNVVLSANSSEFYDIAVMVTPLKQGETEVHGTITPSSDKSNAGNGIALKITPDEGYWLAGIVVVDEDNHEVTTTLQDDLLRSPYAFFVMPSSNVTVYAAFQPKYSFDAETGELKLLCGDFNYKNKFSGVTASEVKSVTAVTESEQNEQHLIGGVRFFGVCEALFAAFSNCETMDLHNVNTEAMTSTENMFYGCSRMSTLNLNGWDGSNIANSKNMFYGCDALNHLTLSPEIGITADMNLSNARYGWMAEGATTVASGRDENVAVIPAPATTTTYLWAKDVLGYAYEYDSETKTLTLNWGDYYYRDAGWKDITITDVEHIVAKDDVRFVGNCVGLFMYFTNCKSIDLRGVDVLEMTSMENMFMGCRALTSLNTFGWNTGKLTNMRYAFKECESIEHFNITHWNTEKVESMNGLFNGCKKLKSIDLSGLNTSSVWDMGNMFYGCSALEEINLSGLNTSKVTSMSRMFYGCSSLWNLDLTGLDTEKVASVTEMFRGCAVLTDLDLSGLNLSNVMQMEGMFRECSNLRTLNLSSLNTQKAIGMGYNSLIENMFKDATELGELTLGKKTPITEKMELCNGKGHQGWVTKDDQDVVSGNGTNAVIDAPEAKTIYIWKYLPEPVILYDMADNRSTIAESDGYVADVTLEGRTLYKDGDWNTLCLPFSLSADEIAATDLAGADIRTLSSASFEESSGVLTLNFTPAAGDDPDHPAVGSITAIEPGVPYIIRWEKAADYVDDAAHNIVNPKFTGVTICKDMYPVDVTGVITFTGTYTATDFLYDDKSLLFLGAENTLYYPKVGASIKAQRAFFQLADGITASDVAATRLFFGDENETTAIRTTNYTNSNEWYTLDGRRLQVKPTKKGMYIHGNKKVVVK